MTYRTKDTGEAIALALCGILDLGNCERRVTTEDQMAGRIGVCFWFCDDTEARRVVSDAYFAQIHRGGVADLPPVSRDIAIIAAETLRLRKQIARDFSTIPPIYV